MAKITRPQLAAFIKDARTIRAFERLFEAVTLATDISTLIAPKFAENVATQQYISTAPAIRTVIDVFTASNGTGGAATLAVYLVPSGGSPGAGNLVIPARSVAAGAVERFVELTGKTLETGDAIWTTANTASALVIGSTGRRITE